MDERRKQFRDKESLLTKTEDAVYSTLREHKCFDRDEQADVVREQGGQA